MRVRPPAWVPTALDLTYHLSRVRLAEGEGMERLLDLAALMHMSPLDPARPLWQGMLVEGLPDGRAARWIASAAAPGCLSYQRHHPDRWSRGAQAE